MAKPKTHYTCSSCGQETSGWLGRCPGCGAWNTLVEEKTATVGNGYRGPWTGAAPDSGRMQNNIVSLADISSQAETRLGSGMREFDRVLGGGFVRGSLVLIGGDPGIGKSTLLLQTIGLIGRNQKTLYISGEESPRQIRLRADRLGLSGESVRLLAATEFSAIAAALTSEKPDLAIVDSIQTLYVEELSSAPGTVSQIGRAHV